MSKNFIRALLTLALAFAGTTVRGQYMPVVFDKVYGDGGQIECVAQTPEGDVVMAARDVNRIRIAWLDRMGEVRASRLLTGYVDITVLKPLAGGKVLVAGQSGVSRSQEKSGMSVSGRASVLNADGRLLHDMYVGGEGSSLTVAEQLPDGSLLLGGYEFMANGGKRGLVARFDLRGRELFRFVPASGEFCAALEVIGTTGEYVCAAFSSENGDAATVVRLDGKGKAYYSTRLPAEDLRIEAMEADVSDGSVVVIGDSDYEGGMVYKLRAEGDVVFSKRLVPASTGISIDHLCMARNGNILVGGSGDQGYYALMRSDGTSLASGTFPGRICGVAMNETNGESVVTSFDSRSGRGAFLRLDKRGRRTGERTVNGAFDRLRIDNAGDVLLVSTAQGRVGMISALGTRMFDRYVTEGKPELYDEALLMPSGEVVFFGMGNRMVKMGHGLYISDVKITKPVAGYVTALFTVTLTGYATTPEGMPIPVTVDYTTHEGTATKTNNFTPVGGKLSFIPSGGEESRYLVKQDIEVPIRANDLIEGNKEFSLELSGVEHSYLIKSTGRGLIEDQQAVVKLISATEGIEAQRDVTYELGLFKTDGTPLRNATGASIVVDGHYGKGTADLLDFDMGILPRALFADGSHTASVQVKTLSDTRYELPKSVVVNFSEVHALSTANVGFDGAQLSCTGVIVDQPAVVSIASLGDHSRINNNVVSGFFSVSLRRASDGALLTNHTGGDIILDCASCADASAQEGLDFVLTNRHNLRIGGTGNSSATNLMGVVLYRPDDAGVSKQVRVAIEKVSSPEGAVPVTVSAENGTAEFTIMN